MNKTKEAKRIELATKRLEKLTKKGMMECVLDDFKSEGTVYYSDRTPFGGMLYWCNDAGGCDKEVIKKIEELKSKDCTPYHVTHELLNDMETYTIWCITDEDLDFGEEDFDDYNITFAYVVNKDVPEFSEYGSVGFKLVGGGAIRV